MTEVASARAGRRGIAPSRFAVVAVVAALLGTAGAAGVHRSLHRGGAAPARFAPPSLNGQIVWDRGERPEPSLVLRDQDGAAFALASARGRTVLVAFLGSRCGRCSAVARAIGQTIGLLPSGARPELAIVGTPGDTPVDARAAVKRWQLPRGVHWLVGSAAQLARVRHDFGVPATRTRAGLEPAHVLYLIDRDGYERAGYLYPFLPNVVAGDLARLAGEGS